MLYNPFLCYFTVNYTRSIDYLFGFIRYHTMWKTIFKWKRAGRIDPRLRMDAPFLYQRVLGMEE